MRAARGVGPPQRLLEFVGAGPNQWTAAEGALKVRETAYVAAEGLLGRAAPRTGRPWRSGRAMRWSR